MRREATRSESDWVAVRVRQRSPVLLVGAVVALALPWPHPSGAQWQAGGVPVTTAPMNQGWPFMIEDGRGGAFIAWRDQRDSAATGWDIYAQRIGADGVAQWAADGVPVCALIGNQFNPNLAPDGADGVIVAWEDARSGSFRIYAQRLDPSGAPLWGPGGVLLQDSGLPQFLDQLGHPSIAADGAGGAMVVWEELVTGTESNLRTQRIDGAGTPLWGPDGVSVCTAPSFQGCPNLVADGAGGAIITWEDWRFWPVAHTYAQRLDAAGEPQWAANGILVSSLAGDQRHPRLIPDGSGGAIFAYSDKRQSSSEIFAQRVNGAGLLEWAPDGVPLCAVAGPQRAPSIVPDGSGGAIVAWLDSRSNPSCVGGCFDDVYAQRVSATGEAQWTTDGVGVCTAASQQGAPAAVGDGAGGAVMVWADGREPPGVYVQRLNSQGAPQWAVDGVRLTGSAANGLQSGQRAIPDGAGGAIVAWIDGRNGTFGSRGWVNADLYAARVSTAGPVDVPGPAAPSRLRLLAPRPNPMATTTSVGFALPMARRVTVEIWDSAGKRVRTLARSREYAAGTHTLTWDGRDGSGRLLASGVYLVRLATAGVWESRKIVLLR